MSWIGDKLREIAEKVYDNTGPDEDLPETYDELNDLADKVEDEEKKDETPAIDPYEAPTESDEPTIDPYETPAED